MVLTSENDKSENSYVFVEVKLRSKLLYILLHSITIRLLLTRRAGAGTWKSYLSSIALATTIDDAFFNISTVTCSTLIE